jgi:hypothetical protein
MHTYSNGGAGAATPPVTPVVIPTVVGTGLNNRKLSKIQRAVMAADTYDGVLRLNPSQKQLAAIFNVSVTYLTIALGLPPARRTAIMRGEDPVSFTELMNPPRQLSLAGPVIPNLKMVTDGELETMIRNAGVERVLEAAVTVERDT